jgi:hypothetical protein
MTSADGSTVEAKEGVEADCFWLVMIIPVD